MSASRRRAGSATGPGSGSASGSGSGSASGSGSGRASGSAAGPASEAAAGWSPWRVVVMFGATSLAADMVYEGARSLYGPMLAALGASAVLVGVVTGAGEAAALALRLVFGPWADRTGGYWAMTITGYAITVVAVPLMALSPLAGGAGLVLGCVLIIVERTGKAVRSPAKTALLARFTAVVGRGRGFGVHKAMDQTGAFAGPLLVAAVAALAGSLWWGLAALAVPGVVAMAVLLTVRARVPDVEEVDEIVQPPQVEGRRGPSSGRVAGRVGARVSGRVGAALGVGLPGAFFAYAAAAALMTAGLVTFGLIGYHLTVSGLVAGSLVPVLYAAGMLAEAVGALVVGWFYDRVAAKVLVVVPVLVAAVPGLALSGRLWAAVVGIGVWGLAFGVQDSTVKALVADVVDAPRRATAYGVFAAVQGGAALIGGATSGWLYERSVTALVIAVVIVEMGALGVLGLTIRRSGTGRA